MWSRFDQLKSWVMSSTRNKVIFGVAVVVIIEGLVYVARKTARKQNIKKENKEKQIQIVDKSYNIEDLQNETATTYEQENPLLGHSKKVIIRFLDKIKNSEILLPHFKEDMLKQGSAYSVSLQKYMLMVMGGPYIDHELDLKGIHQPLHIPRPLFLEWVRLWKQAEREEGVPSKDIWGDIEQDIVY